MEDVSGIGNPDFLSLSISCAGSASVRDLKSFPHPPVNCATVWSFASPGGVRAEANMVRFLAVPFLVLSIGLSACEQHPKTAANTVSPEAGLDTDHHGGGVTTYLPARTGTEASGVEGSSTVVGAPPKGQNPAANAHD
ncbi:MAG TPA: hypothetical protein VGM25_00655 [Caulobacteraceae bacterium]|jgi:hypothetical protein